MGRRAVRLGAADQRRGMILAVASGGPRVAVYACEGKVLRVRRDLQTGPAPAPLMAADGPEVPQGTMRRVTCCFVGVRIAAGAVCGPRIATAWPLDCHGG